MRRSWSRVGCDGRRAVVCSGWGTALDRRVGVEPSLRPQRHAHEADQGGHLDEGARSPPRTPPRCECRSWRSPRRWPARSCWSHVRRQRSPASHQPVRLETSRLRSHLSSRHGSPSRAWPLAAKGNADRGRDLQRAPAHAPRTPMWRISARGACGQAAGRCFRGRGRRGVVPDAQDLPAQLSSRCASDERSASRKPGGHRVGRNPHEGSVLLG